VKESYKNGFGRSREKVEVLERGGQGFLEGLGEEWGLVM